MYPANPGNGYRQKGLKNQGMNGLTSLGLGPGMSTNTNTNTNTNTHSYPASNSNSNSERRSTRGHSPVSPSAIVCFSRNRWQRAEYQSSVTTTSSKSSRRNGSIGVAEPQAGQHQLPAKPEWSPAVTTTDIPYQPGQFPAAAAAGASSNEFPPLRYGQGYGVGMPCGHASINGSAYGNGYTRGPPGPAYAQPMQLDRAGPWNPNAMNHGLTSRNTSNKTAGSRIASGDLANNPSQTRTSVPGLPHVPILPPSSINPGVLNQPQLDHLNNATAVATKDDPDVPPRRERNTSQALFDPREDKSGGAMQIAVNETSEGQSQVQDQTLGPNPSLEIGAEMGVGAGVGVAARAGGGPSAGGGAGGVAMSVEDEIEAKLAAVSLKEGVVIGPPPNRNQLTGGYGQIPPSYAKIVRRD
jgi:hypothetical protein